MEKRDFKKYVLLIVIGATAFLVVNNLNLILGLINKLFGVFLPFILGCITAFILNIPMTKIENWLKGITKTKEKKGSIRVLAIILSLTLFMLIISFVLFLLLPELIENIKSLVQSMPRLLDSSRIFVLDLLKNYPEIQYEIENFFMSANLTTIATNILNSLANGLIGLFSNIISGFITFFMSLIFSIYILCQKEYLQNTSKKLLTAYVKKEKANKIQEIVKLASKTFSKFISGQCLEAIILGTLLFIALIIFRLPYALLIAVLTSITALVPIFGALIAMLVGALLIAIENPFQALIFILVFQVIQQIEGNFIYPRVVGKSVGLSPMWTLLAITVSGSLLGIPGMLIGLPLASILYALIRNDVNNKVKKKEAKTKKLTN